LTIASKLKRLVVDIDDDILSIPSDNPNYKFWYNEENGQDFWGELPAGEEDDPKWEAAAKARGGFVGVHPKTGKKCMVLVKRHPWEIACSILKAAHLVTVSTETMRQCYKKFNSNIVVIPNAIDFDNYPKIIKPKADNIIRLGMFGSHTHYRDWKVIAKPLRSILQEFPNVHLCFNAWYRATGHEGASRDEQVLTGRFPDYFEKLGFIEHPQVEIYGGVEIEMYHEWLVDKQIDIGLAPLCASEFNKAKSNIKYLEFGALHVPIVAQDMEPYNTDIQNGYNGFLAGDSSQWMKAIRTLIKDADLRRNMGEAAFKDVKTRYDARDVSKLLGNEIKKIMGVGYEEVPDYTRRSGAGSRSGLVLAR
jgi:glycosyltransferase involved in cell wall biosynthesis